MIHIILERGQLMTHSYSSHIHTARVMLAVLLLTGAAGISVQAEQAESTGGGGDTTNDAADSDREESDCER